jgi:hypothetical protein
MEKEKIKEIVDNVESKPNKILMEARDKLITEFTETKDLIIKLTHHLDAIEEFYNKINKELNNRIK